MADPEYDSENTPSRKAARAALAPRDELPEDWEELTFDETQQLPGATVLSPAMTESPRYFQDPEHKVPSRFRRPSDPIAERPDELVEAPMASITHSPRAARGGKGETNLEIEATDEEGRARFQAANDTLRDLGFVEHNPNETPEERRTLYLHELHPLMDLHNAGAIVLPPKALAAMNELFAAAETGHAYSGVANVNRRIMNSESE